MSDLFNHTPRTGHPNTLLIGDMIRGIPKPEMRRRFEAREYAGAHPAYLAEAGFGERSA